MWRRTYLVLLLIRVYFALSPSYLHPDENFQGPEVFAGRIFSFPSKLTWEFTSDHPIRSAFPLWPVYDVPMSLLKWFYNEIEAPGNPPPELTYYVLRGVMFLLSFVLEDWAVYELVPSPRHRRETIVLVASSYVTWTYQTHTFSNSLETLLVAWGLVLIRRVVENKSHSSFFSCAVLSFIAVVGVFNRITFPAFLLLPGLQLLPHFVRKPSSLLSFVSFGLIFTYIAIFADTVFYRPSLSTWDALRSPIITPLNNLLYNANTSNLSLHGLHPHYQHFLVNLPQLLGPVYFMMIWSFVSRPTTIPSWLRNTRALSAISATAMLSIFPHQEPRFLIPCIPLLLSCFRLRKSRAILAIWVIFNAALGFLMGVYHQGGVVPTQLAIPSIISANAGAGEGSWKPDTKISATVFWWKTYSPPLWLLGDNSSLALDITTRDMMGSPGLGLIQEVEKTVPSCADQSNTGVNPADSVYVVAPKSATFLDQYTSSSSSSSPSTRPEQPPDTVQLAEVWTYRKHLNLDDLDFGTDGIIPTLTRVIGRRGLSVWAVRRVGCTA